MNLILSRSIVTLSVAALVMLPAARAQAPAPAPAPAGAAPSPSSEVFKKEEIEQLVAPIALYPDALVAQDPDGLDLSAGSRRSGPLVQGEPGA